MTDRARRVALLACLLGAAGNGMGSTVALPKRVADYRFWNALTAKPQLVPHALAVQCALVTERQLEGVRKSYGPHTNRWVTVYANPPALAVLSDGNRLEFPPGSIIVKEKLRQPGDVEAEGVAFMIKHPRGQLPESGGWEFSYLPASGAKASYDHCIACHKTGAARDYVFGSYVRPSLK